MNDLRIPKKELSVFEDFSGPVLHLYAGEDWEKDKVWFETHSKVHGKMDKTPRFLTYHGLVYGTKKSIAMFGQRITPGKLMPYLVHDDDMGRDYDLNPGEPFSYETMGVMNDFNRFFTKVVKTVKETGKYNPAA